MSGTTADKSLTTTPIWEFRPADSASPGDVLPALARVLRSARATEARIQAALSSDASLEAERPEAVAAVIESACRASLMDYASTPLGYLALPLGAAEALGLIAEGTTAAWRKKKRPPRAEPATAGGLKEREASGSKS